MPTHTPLKDIIVNMLYLGPMEKAHIIENGCKQNSATPQGVYKALRLLRDREIIASHQKTVSLSLAWIEKEAHRLKTAEETYKARAHAQFLLKLRDGEHRTFRFRTLLDLHLFWVQAFFILESQIPPSVPTYAFAPHDWFYDLAPGSDEAWARRLRKSYRFQGATITHATAFDRRVIRERKVDKVEFVFNKNPLGLTYQQHLNLIGPWIIMAKLDKKVARLIDIFAQKHEKPSPATGEELSAILNTRGSHTLKITRSQKRADKIVRAVKNYFTFR